MLARVESHVEFDRVERPRDEDHVTLLIVEREVTHVQGAVGLDDSRKHPEHVTVGGDDRVCVEEVLETVVGAG